IYVFDCVEFSPSFRANDVASEVAFLAMDLESLDCPELARRFVAAYARAADDPAVDVLLPFYACYRACVRGKVEGLASAEAAVAAGRGVVADATFIQARDRRRLAAAAGRERRPYVFVECRAPESVVRDRLLGRETEPQLSDARWDTYVEQRACREPFGADEP